MNQLHEVEPIIDPYAAIQNLRQRINTMGANDSEMSDINNIETLLRQGKITPQEAVNKVNTILNNKQDYH